MHCLIRFCIFFSWVKNKIVSDLMQGSQQGKPREGVVYRKSKEKPGKIMEKWRERERERKKKKKRKTTTTATKSIREKLGKIWSASLLVHKKNCLTLAIELFLVTLLLKNFYILNFLILGFYYICSVIWKSYFFRNLCVQCVNVWFKSM